MAVSVSSKGSVGSRLKRARSRRRLQIEQIAQETRISSRFLEALERDAPPGEFPAPMYARAFLREYARFLGLDPEPLVEGYRQAHEVEEEPPAALPRPVRQPNVRLTRWILVILSVGALATITVFTARSDRTEVVPPPPPPQQPSPPPSVEALPPEVKETPEFDGLVLALKVRDVPSWVQVARGDRILIAETKPPGFSRTFRARRLDVEIGAPGSVRLTLNGRRIDLGDSGEVFRSGFVFRGGRARPVAYAG